MSGNVLMLRKGLIGWSIDVYRDDDSLMKSLSDADDARAPLQPIRLVRLLSKSDATQTMANRFSPFGSPDPVKMWLTMGAKREMRDSIFRAMRAGRIPADSLIRLDSGTLSVDLVKAAMNISDAYPDDDVEQSEETAGILRKAYERHQEHAESASELRAAAEELNALVEKLNDRSAR